MKEKTFEELIAGKTFIENKVYEDDEDNMVLERHDVLILLQQVREATIAECMEIAHEHWLSPSFSPKHSINRLPTDRIRIEPLQKFTR